MTNNSISIILRQYKEEHISEQEAITLINDVVNNYRYVPYYPWWNNGQVTWETNQTIPEFKKFEVTCKHD